MAKLPNIETHSTHSGLWDRYVRWLKRVTPGESVRSSYCHNYKSQLSEKPNRGGIIIPRKVNRVKTVIDPVCEMEMDAGNTSLFSIYHGIRYYFCCESCRKAFKEHPQKFLASKHKKPLGVWGRYVKRLEKISGGGPMRCH